MNEEPLGLLAGGRRGQGPPPSHPAARSRQWLLKAPESPRERLGFWREVRVLAVISCAKDLERAPAKGQ